MTFWFERLSLTMNRNILIRTILSLTPALSRWERENRWPMVGRLHGKRHRMVRAQVPRFGSRTTSKRQLPFESPTTSESGVAQTCHRTPRRQARYGRFMVAMHANSIERGLPMNRNILVRTILLHPPDASGLGEGESLSDGLTRRTITPVHRKVFLPQ